MDVQIPYQSYLLSFLLNQLVEFCGNHLKQDASVPRNTIYQMARLFSLAGAVMAGNIIHDYTAVLYVHGYMNNNDLYSQKGLARV